MQSLIVKIHNQAKLCAEKLKSCEYEMIEALQGVDKHKVYRAYRAKSLFQYAVVILGLSRDRAYDYICVARKSQKVSKLAMAIRDKKLTVSKARRLTKVITQENATEWIDIASKSSQHTLERIIASKEPNAAEVIEGVIWVSATKLKLTVGIDEKTDILLKKVQDLESQRQKRHVTLGETLEILAKEYLKKNDPVEKAKRNLARARQIKPAAPAATTPIKPARLPIPATLKHQVYLRDQGKCQAPDISGKCDESRWIELHHIRPVSHGGENTLGNLTTLCWQHHRMEHAAEMNVFSTA